MDWLVDNWVDISAIVGAMHVLALVIVNMTKTPKDNDWVGRVYRWFEIFGGLITSRSKETKDEQKQDE